MIGVQEGRQIPLKKDLLYVEVLPIQNCAYEGKKVMRKLVNHESPIYLRQPFASLIIKTYLCGTALHILL